MSPILRRRWLWLALLAWTSAASAHPLAPALLELSQRAPAQYDVLWRTSISRAQDRAVEPVLPAACRPLGESAAHVDGDALEVRWRVDCADGGISGQAVAVRGLEASGITVILRVVDAEGRTASSLLTPAEPVGAAPVPAGAGLTLLRFVDLGVRHLAGGLDHLCFVAALVLLVAQRRRLVIAVTAFTLGHSATLSLATLGWVTVAQAPMELLIAISVLVLAAALARPAGAPTPWLARRPALAAGAFGLVHGLGFAGALADAGLPHGDVPIALLGFNLGVELGQLGWIALLLLAGAVWRHLAWGWERGPVVAAYVIGTLAASWCWERAVALWPGAG